MLSRRWLVFWAAWGLARFAWAGPAGAAAQGTRTGSTPNVVLIISDDQAWTDYSFMGHAHIRTPQLDKLAAQSLTFRRGYVPSSLCSPSLASILTGLYPTSTRSPATIPRCRPARPEPRWSASLSTRPSGSG